MDLEKIPVFEREQEHIENAVNLDERAVTAKKSEMETEALISEFAPFLRSRVSKYSSRFNEQTREDMLSVAMLAFHEAVQKYNIKKGHFFSFANRVVCARIIDQVRKINRQEGKTVALYDDDEQQLEESAAIREISIRNYDAEQRRARMAEEIEQFMSELITWNISMDALVKSSPKHRELRGTYRNVISEVVQSPDIMQTIHIKRYFPIKEISKITGLPHKKLERARTFILASLIVKTGDYELLTDYLNEGGRGKA